MAVRVLKKNALKCLRERKGVDIVLLITAALPQVIMEVMKVVDIGLNIPASLPQLITKVVDVGQV